MFTAQEIITTDLGMLSFGSDMLSDEHLTVLKQQFDNEILNENFMSNADMNLCNENQAIIYTALQQSLKSLATDAAIFIKSLLELNSVSSRQSFVSDPQNFDLSKYAHECVFNITKSLEQVAIAQLG
ncbi:hypothetical protein [Photobacterium damselae]|uniref:hypothetical protein n=1 Tax=Photobacterium damselae TaxID=38293 RepID=UPI004068B908